MAQNGEGAVEGRGYLLEGEVVGWKKADSFTRGENTFAVPPKVGIRFGDQVVEVRCATDDEARGVAAAAKGSVVILPVILRAPYGSQGKIKVLTAAADAESGFADSGWQ